jgi:hypothetical protein
MNDISFGGLQDAYPLSCVLCPCSCCYYYRLKICYFRSVVIGHYDFCRYSITGANNNFFFENTSTESEFCLLGEANIAGAMVAGILTTNFPRRPGDRGKFNTTQMLNSPPFPGGRGAGVSID